MQSIIIYSSVLILPKSNKHNCYSCGAWKTGSPDADGATIAMVTILLIVDSLTTKDMRWQFTSLFIVIFASHSIWSYSHFILEPPAGLLNTDFWDPVPTSDWVGLGGDWKFYISTKFTGDADAVVWGTTL